MKKTMVILGILAFCLILISLMYIRYFSSNTKLFMKEIPMGKCGDGYDPAKLLLSPDKNRIAYVKPQGQMTGFVIDGVQQKTYDRVYNLSFSPNSKHFLYVGQKEAKRFIVIDGVEGKPYDSISNITLTSDWERIAYVAGQRISRTGAKSDNSEGTIITSEPVAEQSRYFEYPGGPSTYRVVLDGQEQGTYNEINNITFSPDGKHLAYVAKIGSMYCVVLNGTEGEKYHQISHIRFLSHTGEVVYAARRYREWMAVVGDIEGKQYDSFGKDDPVCSFDGKRYAYCAKRGNKWMAIVDGVEGPQYDAISRVFFSPDSKRVLYAVRQGDKELVVVDGQEEKRYEGQIGRIPIFSPDSKHVAYAIKQKLKLLLSNTLKTWIAVIDGTEQKGYDGIGELIFSPDSQHVTYAALDGEKSRVVLDGNEQEIYDGVNFVNFSPDSMQLAYSVNVGKTPVTLKENECENKEMTVPEIPQFDDHGFPIGKIESTTTKIKSPNEKGIKHIKKAAGQWRVVTDKIKGKKYDMVVNGTFSPDGKHFVYWAKDGDGWGIIVDDAESEKYYDLLHTASGNQMFPSEYPNVTPEEAYFFHGLCLYYLRYLGSEFIFDTSTTFHTFAKRGDTLYRLQVEIVEK